MTWTVLSDNRTNDQALETEHGLSIFLETHRHSILLDTGASDVFIRNAERLGIDLSTVDYVFISHGHSDHAGGLRYFVEVNKTAKIIVSPDAISGRFYSKHRCLHSITTTWPSIPAWRLLAIEHSGLITDGLSAIARIPQTHPMPKGNQHLFFENATGEYVQDSFSHELALYVDGLLFSGCAHSGLENFLAACPRPVHSVLGGFHLLDGCESDEELTALATRLKDKYPDTHFYTSHCTGDHAFQVMKNLMGEQLQAFNCGYQKGARRVPSLPEDA